MIILAAMLAGLGAGALLALCAGYLVITRGKGQRTDGLTEKAAGPRHAAPRQPVLARAHTAAQPPADLYPDLAPPLHELPTETLAAVSARDWPGQP